MAENLNLKSPREDLTKEKLKKFKAKFKEYFKSKYKDFIEEAKLTGLWEWLSSDTQKDKWKIVKGASTYLGRVPVIGQAVRVIMPIINGSISLVAGYQHLLKSKRIAQVMNEVLDSFVNLVIKEVAFETVRIYEYQIGMLKKQHVEELAQHAVDCIFAYCEDEDASFERNTLLYAMANGKIPSNKDNKKLETINNDIWKLFNVLKKPGLRKQYVNPDTQERKFMFFRKVSSDENGACMPFRKVISCEPNIYGFRGEILDFDDSQKLFTNSEYDKCFTEIPQPSNDTKFHQKYQPIYVIANELDLLKYVDFVNENHPNIQPFSEFIKQIYNIDKDVAVSLYFTRTLHKINLNCGTFDEVRFLRINFASLCDNIINLSFIGSKLFSADFTSVVLKCNFNYAHMSYCNFKNASIEDCSFLRVKIKNSSFAYCEVRKDENLKQAIEEKSNNFKHAKFMSNPGRSKERFDAANPSQEMMLASGEPSLDNQSLSKNEIFHGFHYSASRKTLSDDVYEDAIDSGEDEMPTEFEITDYLIAARDAYQHYLENLPASNTDGYLPFCH